MDYTYKHKKQNSSSGKEVSCPAFKQKEKDTNIQLEKIVS